VLCSPSSDTPRKNNKKLQNKTDMATYNGVVSKMAEASYKPMCV